LRTDVARGCYFAGPLEDCAEYTKMGVPGQDGKLLCMTGYLLSHMAVVICETSHKTDELG